MLFLKQVVLTSKVQSLIDNVRNSNFESWAIWHLQSVRFDTCSDHFNGGLLKITADNLILNAEYPLGITLEQYSLIT